MNEIPEWAIRDASEIVKVEEWSDGDRLILLFPNDKSIGPTVLRHYKREDLVYEQTDEVAKEIREKIASWLVAQMERDCRAVCFWCEDNYPLNKSFYHIQVLPSTGEEVNRECRAEPIRRAAAEATRPGEGSGRVG